MKLDGKTNVELLEVMAAIESDPANRMPTGHLHLYTPKACKKLNKIAWQITSNLADKRKADGDPRAYLRLFRDEAKQETVIMKDFPYYEGEKAFKRGDKRESCPHKKPISKQRHYWMLGWDTANEQDARAAVERKMGIRD